MTGWTVKIGIITAAVLAFLESSLTMAHHIIWSNNYKSNIRYKKLKNKILSNILFTAAPR